MKAPSAYFDASVLVSLFVVDSFADRAQVYMRDHQPIPIVSDFAAAEFASAVGRLVRTELLDLEHAFPIFAAFDGWRSQSALDCAVETSDVAAAGVLLRRLDAPLRVPAALHLAMALRMGVALATFDARLADIALRNGVDIAPA